MAAAEDGDKNVIVDWLATWTYARGTFVALIGQDKTTMRNCIDRIASEQPAMHSADGSTFLREMTPWPPY